MFKKIFIIPCFLIPCLTFAQPVCTSEEQCLTLAKKNNVEAQSELGELYYLSKKGVTNQYQKALTWFEKSATAGNEKAQYYLGVCYYYGEGVAKDLMTAKEWFTKAADKGYEPAKHYLELLKENK